MRSKALPGWARTLCTAAAALVFLLVYELAVYRVPVTEIFLPVSSWSDEVIYSKQLAAAVRYGAPQGYFGFNESHAAVGTYAAWGPAVFLVYALPGLLLRGQNAFLWCNLLFVVLGWTFFARAARLGWKRQLTFAAALAAMNAPIRYVFSAMQEPLHYALMLAVLSCGILVRRDKSRAAWAALCVLCAVATLVRPYEAVLWLFPLALCWPDRRRIAVCAAGGALSLGGTLVLMSKFYAPYFFTNVDLGPLQELARGQVVSAVRDVAHKLLDALRTAETAALDLAGEWEKIAAFRRVLATLPAPEEKKPAAAPKAEAAAPAAAEKKPAATAVEKKPEAVKPAAEAAEKKPAAATAAKTAAVKPAAKATAAKPAVSAKKPAASAARKSARKSK